MSDEDGDQQPSGSGVFYRSSRDQSTQTSSPVNSNQQPSESGVFYRSLRDQSTQTTRPVNPMWEPLTDTDMSDEDGDQQPSWSDVFYQSSRDEPSSRPVNSMWEPVADTDMSDEDGDQQPSWSDVFYQSSRDEPSSRPVNSMWEPVAENAEFEILTNAETTAAYWDKCQKYTDHSGFIAASPFTVDHLPLECSDYSVHTCIQLMSDLTVRLNIRRPGSPSPIVDSSHEVKEAPSVTRMCTGFLSHIDIRSWASSFERTVIWKQRSTLGDAQTADSEEFSDYVNEFDVNRIKERIVSEKDSEEVKEFVRHICPEHLRHLCLLVWFAVKGYKDSNTRFLRELASYLQVCYEHGPGELDVTTLCPQDVIDHLAISSAMFKDDGVSCRDPASTSDHATTNISHDATTNMPDDATTNIPDDTMPKIPRNPTTIISEDAITNIPGGAATNISSDPTTNISGDETTKISSDTTSNIFGNLLANISGDAATKISSDTITNISDYTTSNISDGPTTSTSADSTTTNVQHLPSSTSCTEADLTHVDPCPCPECKNMPSPQPPRFVFHVLTDRRAVLDNEEAANTVVDLEIEGEVKHLYGQKVHRVSDFGDLQYLQCVTHEVKVEQWIKEKSAAFEKVYRDLCMKVSRPLAVICSYPHGHRKMISVGEWTARFSHDCGQTTPLRYVSYEYTTPTCPGSTGAPVLILGQMTNYNPRVRNVMHSHYGTLSLDRNKSGIGLALIY